MSLDIESVKRKVRALLARNVENGASIAEAETCLEKAYQLLDEFNLDIEELLKDTDPNTKKVIKEELYVSGNISPELKYLYNAVAKLFHCEIVTSRRVAAGYKYRVVYIQCIGNPINVEKVKYFMSLFEDTIQKAIKQEYITGLRNINSFRRGFYMSLANKAYTMINERDKKEKEEEKKQSSTALVLVEDKKNIEEYMAQEFPNLVQRTINFNNYGKSTERNSFNKGQSYGNSMGFNDAVKGSKALLKG